MKIVQREIAEKKGVEQAELVMPDSAELLAATPGHGVGRGGKRKSSNPKKDNQVQRTEFPSDQGWKDQEVMRALNNLPPTGSIRTTAIQVPKSPSVRGKYSSYHKIVKKVPKHPTVAKALKKSKMTHREKLGVNDKGVVPLTASRSGLAVIARCQKRFDLLIRKLPFQ